MQNIPTIVGLQSNENGVSRCGRITRMHWMLIGIILLSLLSLSLLITVIVQTRKASGKDDSKPTNEYCLSDGCLTAASHQLRWMDKNASGRLCTDFHSYACGGWKSNHPTLTSDTERTVLGDIVERRNDEIERLLIAPITRPFRDSWEYKLKTYYVECIDDYARALDSGQRMISLIMDPGTIDGWFLFDNSAENSSQEFLLKNQSLYTQVSHIQGDLGAAALFGIRTRFNEKNPNIKNLEFYPAGLSMEVNDFLNDDPLSESRRAAFQEYILEVVGLLARDAGITDENLSDRAFTIANDVSTVETFLAESLKRSSSNSRLSMMTLQDISAQFSFNFTALMKHVLNDDPFVTDMSTVYINNLMYFTDAFEYFNNDADPVFARMIHNYFRWHLVSTYIDDLSYDYIHAHRVFLDAYYKYTLHSSHEDYCTREVIRRLPLATQRLYTMNSPTHSAALQTVQTLFDALKTGFLQYINEQATWMDESTKQTAREKINALTIAIGYTSIAFDDKLLDQYYDKLFVSESSHFENAVLYRRFYLWTISNTLQNPNILEHWDLFEARTSRLFDYIALFNRLFVVSSAVREPLVHSDWPWSMSVGSLGVLLAQKLFSSIDIPNGRTHLANGTQVSDWWSSSTANGYNTSRSCITDYYVNELKALNYTVGGTSIMVRLSGEPFTPTTLRHIGALRLAYNALKKIDTNRSIRLPGTNFNSEQTFFFAYAQTQCFQRSEFIQLISTQLGTYDERTALNTALIHMPEFAQAFQCPRREKMCF